MTEATVLLVWGIMAHFTADWLFQTDWMADHKTNLLHPAAWVHGVIHVMFLMFVFPWNIALLLGVSHVLVDTRVPLHWWMKHIKRMKDGPHIANLEVWLDQIFHILLLAAAVIVFY